MSQMNNAAISFPRRYRHICWHLSIDDGGSYGEFGPYEAGFVLRRQHNKTVLWDDHDVPVILSSWIKNLRNCDDIIAEVTKVLQAQDELEQKLVTAHSCDRCSLTSSP